MPKDPEILRRPRRTRWCHRGYGTWIGLKVFPCAEAPSDTMAGIKPVASLSDHRVSTRLMDTY